MVIARNWNRFARLVFGVVAMTALAGDRVAWSHPLHTTLTEIALDSTDCAMRLTIRAFADDFSAVVARHAGKPRPADYRVSDTDVASYVAAAVSVEYAGGRPAPLTWSGVRRTGDVVWVTVKVPSVRSLRGVKIATTLLFEIFDDQVNIVQATSGGRRQSMLFTAGDGRKFKAIS